MRSPHFNLFFIYCRMNEGKIMIFISAHRMMFFWQVLLSSDSWLDSLWNCAVVWLKTCLSHLAMLQFIIRLTHSLNVWTWAKRKWSQNFFGKRDLMSFNTCNDSISGQFFSAYMNRQENYYFTMCDEILKGCERASDDGSGD